MTNSILSLAPPKEPQIWQSGRCPSVLSANQTLAPCAPRVCAKTLLLWCSPAASTTAVIGFVLTSLKRHDIKKCLYCKTTASSRFALETTHRFLESDSAERDQKMPKSFLVKKRVAITACIDSQEIPDTEIKSESGKVQGLELLFYGRVLMVMIYFSVWSNFSRQTFSTSDVQPVILRKKSFWGNFNAKLNESQNRIC